MSPRSRNLQPREVYKARGEKQKNKFSLMIQLYTLNQKFYFISLLCFMSIVILDTAGALRTAKYNTAAAPSVGIRWDSWT